MVRDSARVRPGGERVTRSGWFVLGALAFWIGLPVVGYGGMTGQPLLFWGGIAVMVLGFVAAYDFGEDEFDRRVEAFTENDGDDSP